jgi:hypothetical protein
MHETLINTFERIPYCKKKNISAVMISADLSKAFDSVSHEFMVKCYDFYRFGNRIKRWLQSIGTGRTAKIILDDGTYSPAFKLGKGHAQGDSPSPLLFNFAQQVQIFAIEMNKKILKIRPDPPLPICYEPTVFNESESNFETDKCDGSADDNYTFTLADMNCVIELFELLRRFELLTGLSCNMEKTKAMVIGKKSSEFERELSGLNLKVAKKLKMLGFYISNTEDNQILNFTETSGKITKIINYWKRFDLSMTGRITVIKTLILPHVGFVSTILRPPGQWAAKLNNVCENFVLGTEKVAKTKLYLTPKMGGLGLINMEDFIRALKCSWFKKAILGTNDNWKITLRTVTENFSNLHLVDTTKLECGEVLQNILEAVQFFIKKWDATENNFLTANIVGNTNIGF